MHWPLCRLRGFSPSRTAARTLGYQKPYMTKLIDCGVTTFNALLDQPTMLDREVICHIPKSGELVIII